MFVCFTVYERGTDGETYRWMRWDEVTHDEINIFEGWDFILLKVKIDIRKLNNNIHHCSFY